MFEMGIKTDWFNFIPFVEFASNSSVAESTGFTPFEIIYGSTPAFPVNYLPGLSKAPAVQVVFFFRCFTLLSPGKVTNCQGPGVAEAFL